LKIWLVASLTVLLSLSIIGLNFDEAFAGIVEEQAAVNLVKNVDKPIAIPGTLVTYDYEITNFGVADIICSSVVDDNGTPGNPNDDVVISVIPFTVLSTGDMITVQSTVVIPQQTDDFTNIAVVNCISDLGGLTTDAFATVDVRNPETNVDKSVSKTTVIDGQSVTYSLGVFNGGDIGLENCVLIDKIGFNSGPFSVPIGVVVDFLGIGPVQIFTPGLDNTANLTCDVPTTMGDTHVDSSNQVTVTVVDIGAPTIDKAVTKNTVVANQANPVTITVGGGPLAYENCVVTDPKVGFTSAPFNLVPNTPAQQVFGPLAYSIAATDTNTATVQCFEPITMNNVQASDSETVTVVALGGLVIEKDVDKNMVTSTDNMVTYNYKVTNNVGFGVINCQITDSNLGAVGAQFNLANGAMTNPLIFSNLVPITQTTMNTATVTCFEPTTMNPVTSPVSNEVTVIFKSNPGVSLLKIANPDLILEGETVTYTFDATNTGEVPLFGCNLNDDKLGLIAADFTLAVGESKPFQKSTPIFVNTVNEATVVCLTGVEPPMVSDTAMDKVTILSVGGEFLPIDSTALMLAGLQTSAIWILPAVAGLAGTGYYLIRFRNKE